MAMSDPIADMITRIRNGQNARKGHVTMPLSKKKVAIASVLQDEGFVEGYDVINVGGKETLRIHLKYRNGRPVIRTLRRVSRPGLRVYRGKDDLPVVDGGLGVAIVSTSRGVMAERRARSSGHGGEVVCVVA